MYSILFFDADGTLLDFEKSQLNALKLTFNDHDVPYSDDLVVLYDRINKKYWKMHERGEISREDLIFQRFEEFLNTAGFKREVVAFETSYQDHLGDGAFLLAGALDLVKNLSVNYDLYIITNGVADTQHRRLDASGLSRYMKDIFISGELGVQKPRREYFDACFERMDRSVDRSGILVIGDSLTSDILGGINAGLDTCWYNPDSLPTDPAIRAKYEVHSFKELERLLLL